MLRSLYAIVILAIVIACGKSEEETDESLTINQIGEKYVSLMLYIGQYDEDFIDAYYGPEQLKPAASEESINTIPSDELVWEIHHLIHLLEEIDVTPFDSLDFAHRDFLIKQLTAAKVRVSIISGSKLPFDKESKMVYDAVSPTYPVSYYDSLLAALDEALPGSGSIQDRYQEFASNFVIGPDKLDEVFRIAITEARRRTMERVDLPEGEDFVLEYVTDKSWSGYNWYQGNYKSLIQINTDFPIYVDRVIDLASHEGYPGHHVYNILLEKNLVNAKGWVDFSVYPLFSPQSLIAEGSANFGIEMVFPGKERLEFEKEVIYPMAGLDSSMAESYSEIQNLRKSLSYAGNEAAREYLNGKIGREEAAVWLEKYLLYSPERALQRTNFFDQYRSYVINYNLGQDLVKEYVNNKGGQDEDLRWQAFEELLSTPKTASMLTAQ